MAAGISKMASGFNLPDRSSNADAAKESSTVSALAVLDLHDLLCEMGAVSKRQIRSAGLIRADMADRDPGAMPLQEQRLPEAQLLALWHLAADNVAVPHAGLLIGQTFKPEMHGVLANLLCHCENMGEFMEVFGRHIALMNPSEQWASAIEGETLVLTLSFGGGKAYPRPAVERSMASVMTWTRALTGFPIVPVACEFAFAAPPYRHLYADIFGRRLSFGSKANRLRLPLEIVRRPIAGANAYLKQVLAERAELALRKVATESALVLSVRRHIRSNLRSGAGIENACRSLNLSRPTLYRRLKREGTSYSELVSAVRRELAYLRIQEGAPVAAVSEELGFKDASAFHRACRRWFSQPPSALRTKPDALVQRENLSR